MVFGLGNMFLTEIGVSALLNAFGNSLSSTSPGNTVELDVDVLFALSGASCGALGDRA